MDSAEKNVHFTKLVSEHSKLATQLNQIESVIIGLLKDQDIPLDLRWETMFEVMDSCEGSVWRSDVLSKYKYNGTGHSYWDNRLDNKYRYQIIHLDHEIGRLEDDLEYSLKDPISPYSILNYINDQGMTIDLETIKAVKEEILNEGTTSFEFDW